MNKETKDLLEKYFTKHTSLAFNGAVPYYAPRYWEFAHIKTRYLRWLSVHDDGVYIQVAGQRTAMHEGTRYDTLDEAVAVAVASMELGV